MELKTLKHLREVYEKALRDMEGMGCDYVLLGTGELTSTIHAIDHLIAESSPKFFECGGCGAYHPLGFTGDCRDNINRFNELPDDGILVDEREPND